MDTNTIEEIPFAERVKVAAFGFTTMLTGPKFNLGPDKIKRASELFVKRIKKAHEREEGIKKLILDHVRGV